MAQRKSLTPLGETEIEVLHHVWKLGEATVNDVRDRILKDRKVAYTTIMTVMRKLADKGYLEFHKDGRTYVYSPARPANEVQHSLLKEIMNSVFHGSPMKLVQTLVKHEELSDEEREEMKRLIEQLDGSNG